MSQKFFQCFDGKDYIHFFCRYDALLSGMKAVKLFLFLFMVVLRFYLEYVIDIYNHTHSKNALPAKSWSDHSSMLLWHKVSGCFGIPSLLWTLSYRLIGYFLCCNIKSYDRHSQFSLSNFENTVLIPKWA